MGTESAVVYLGPGGPGNDAQVYDPTEETRGRMGKHLSQHRSPLVSIRARGSGVLDRRDGNGNGPGGSGGGPLDLGAACIPRPCGDGRALSVRCDSGPDSGYHRRHAGTSGTGAPSGMVERVDQDTALVMSPLNLILV